MNKLTKFFDSITIKDSVELMKRIYANKNYPVFEGKHFDLNMGAIRCENRLSNFFDDLIYIFYKINGSWQFFYCRATTDPGKTWLQKPMHPDGAAIVVEGYYPKLWGLDRFHNTDCLRQMTEIKYYRDNNRDDVLDLNPQTITSGFIGILCHISFQPNPAKLVWNSSAGCMVTAEDSDMSSIISLVKKQIDNGFGNRVSFALLNQEDLKLEADLMLGDVHVQSKFHLV